MARLVRMTVSCVFFFVLMLNQAMGFSNADGYVKTKAERWLWSYSSVEELDGFLKNWLDNDPTHGPGSYRWSAADGAATISVTKDFGGAARTKYISQTVWSAPDTIKPGEALEMPITLSGDLLNPPNEPSPDTGVAILEIAAYSGDDLNMLQSSGNKTILATLSQKAIKDQFTCSPTGRYLVVDVVLKNAMLPVGTRYIYEIDGSPYQSGRQVIRATLIRGTASIDEQGIGNLRELSPGEMQMIRVQDRIRTGPDTRLLIHFEDGSVFTVKSNTVMTLMDGGIQIQVGETIHNLQKQGKTFQVVTPTTIFGALGTTFSVSVDDKGNTGIKLYEGVLEVRPLQEALQEGVASGDIPVDSLKTGKPVILKSGESITAEAGVLGEVTVFPAKDEWSGVMEELGLDLEYPEDPPEQQGDSQKHNRSTASDQSDGSSEDTVFPFIPVGICAAAALLLLAIIIAVTRRNKRKKSPGSNAVTQAGQSSDQAGAFPGYGQFCPSCGAQNNPAASFCRQCGKKLR